MSDVLQRLNRFTRRRLLKLGGIGGIGAVLAFFTGTPTLRAQAAAGNISAELADPATRAQMLARARQDARFQRLSEHLQSTAFGPSREPAVLVARRDGAPLRTVVVAEFSGSAGSTAALAFGVEADGSTFSHAIVEEGGTRSALLVGIGGVIQTIRRGPNEVTAQDTLSCFICTHLCAFGLCGFGCVLACVIICGPNVVCTILCAGVVCPVVCFVGCSAGCTALGFCP